MGLDMYLKQKHYVGAYYKHRKVTVSIDIQLDGKQLKIDFNKIDEIESIAGYWRKANAIHKWFVDNIQNGEDNCAEYEVTYNQLLKLKHLCVDVLRSKDPSALPPQAGFFFGSTEISVYYFEFLKETIEIIDSLDPEGDYFYESSW